MHGHGLLGGTGTHAQTFSGLNPLVTLLKHWLARVCKRRPKAWQTLGSLALLVLSWGATAQEHIVSRAFLEDPSGQLGIDQVVDQTFTPFEGLLVRGYTDSAHWVRLQVRQPAASEDPSLQLRIRPTLLDEVQLYESDAQDRGTWHMRRTGDRTPFEASDRSNSALGFLIHPSAPLTTYYLRLQTSGSSMLHVQALPPSEARRKDAWLDLLHILNMGIIGWVLLWTLRLWWTERHPLHGPFVLYQACNLLYLMLNMGLAAAFEPPGWVGLVDWLTSLSVMALVFLATRFNRAVFTAYGAPMFMLRLMDLLSWLVVPGAVLVFVWGHQRLGLQLSALVGILVGLLSVANLFLVRQASPLLPSLTLLRSIYLGLVTFSLASLLPFLGWTGGIEWSLQANAIHGIFNALLMLTLLWQQSRLRTAHTREQQQAMTRLQAQLETEKQHADTTRRFVEMLTHEIKTPVSVALLSVDALKTDNPYAHRIRRALANINAVIDRIRLSNLVEQQSLKPHLAQHGLAPLLSACVDTCTEPTRVKVLVGQGGQTRTDSRLMGVIVHNLIDNALKYSPPDSEVQLSLQRAGQGWAVRVSNTLGDTPVPQPQQLFSKYHRDPSAQGVSGSGLGLYLSRHIAELLGGRLDCHTDTTQIHFELWLPA